MAAKIPPATPEKAWTREILASEQLRARVLVIAMVVLLAGNVGVLTFAGDQVNRFAIRPVPLWLPFAVMGPFLLYENIVVAVLGMIRRHDGTPPLFGRFGNALVEISFPTAIIYVVSRYASPEIAFSTWPVLLYFIFILAGTLRLHFGLAAFTGLVAAVEYMIVASFELPISSLANDPTLIPLPHYARAVIMLVAGVVAGAVALRLRGMVARVMTESAAREQVTNLFGQHVSPSVVDRLLERPAEMSGETREVCVMFLDIRDFTAFSRSRPPNEVVEFLNSNFAYMIEAVDRRGGIINKFLGDGFIALFGAPIEDPHATRHAVACARDILLEVDRRAEFGLPLRVGIGLHVGPAITGNVGSPQRKEFTVIGDTVNMAARMEQLTKEYRARLLVSDAVAKKLGSELGAATLIGEANVKGYDQKVPVWRLD